FYVVMGFLLFVFPNRLFAAVTVVTFLSVVARHSLPRMGVPIQGFFFDGNWPLFASGILVYYQLNYGRRERIWITISALVLGLLYSARNPSAFNGFSTDLSAFIAFSFAILLLLSHRFDSA